MSLASTYHCSSLSLSTALHAWTDNDGEQRSSSCVGLALDSTPGALPRVRTPAIRPLFLLRTPPAHPPFPVFLLLADPSLLVPFAAVALR